MRVLIADDHPLYREAAALQIRRLYPDALVGEVSSLPELRQTTDGSGPYDLILLDYHMPGMSSEALVQLVGEFTTTPLAVISGTDANAEIRAAVHAGLRGFIPKTSSPEHFALALQILLAGGSSVPAEVLLDRPSASSFAAKPWLAKMTEREREVLKGVIQGRSNKEIARQMDVAEVTVKLHLRSVFRKMDVKSRAEAAVKAVKAGFG